MEPDLVKRYSLRDAVRLPGLLSLARLPLALMFVWVADKPVWAIGVLCLSAVTDVLDGWLARRLHQETATGAALDPLMDKVFVLVVALVLLVGGTLTPIEMLLLGTRDLGELLILVWLGLRHRNDSRAARRSNAAGKIATVLQFAALTAVLAGAPYRRIWLVATALSGVVAGIMYWLREARPERT